MDLPYNRCETQKKNWSFRGEMLWDLMGPNDGAYNEIILSPYIFSVNMEILQRSGGECQINLYICCLVLLGWCEEYNKMNLL